MLLFVLLIIFAISGHNSAYKLSLSLKTKNVNKNHIRLMNNRDDIDIEKDLIDMNNNNNNSNNNKGIDIIAGDDKTSSIMEAFNSPEMKKSLYFTLLLTISTICQLLADTYITSLVGNKGSEFSVARGVVGSLLGFAFFVFGFLTDGFTSKVSRVYGSGN